MSFLERINNKLTEKNKAAAERPPNSELVLLLGRSEHREVRLIVRVIHFLETGVQIPEDSFNEVFTFLQMQVVPVDFDEYLDVVRKV